MNYVLNPLKRWVLRLLPKIFHTTNIRDYAVLSEESWVIDCCLKEYRLVNESPTIHDWYNYLNFLKSTTINTVVKMGYNAEATTQFYDEFNRLPTQIKD